MSPLARAGSSHMDSGKQSAAPQALALMARWQAAMTVRAGLVNMGNTCYINSVLACLCGIPVLGNLLRSQPPGMALHRNGMCRVVAPAKCTACLMSKQLLALMAADRQFAIKPMHIVQNLPAVSKTFQRGRQEDSHEFFHCLLDAAERDTKGPKKDVHTLVEQLFQGHSISQVRCLACGHESNTYEAFCSLSLDIGKADSVQDSLGLFSAAEFLDGANKYKCDKCRALVRARKQVAIWDEPNVLTVHFKRFNASPFSFSSGKVGRRIAFTPQLDLEPYAAHKLLGAGLAGLAKAASAGAACAQARCASYDLVGVLVHQGGSVHSGHYFAYVRDSQGHWSCMNDETVYRVSLDTVLQQQAYLLFYVRSEVKALRSPPQQQQQPPNGGPARAATEPVGQVFGPQLPPSNGAVFERQVFGPQLPPVNGISGRHLATADGAAELAAKRGHSLDSGLLDKAAGSAAGHSNGAQPKATAVSSRPSGNTTLMQTPSSRVAMLPAKQPLQQKQQQQQRAATASAAGSNGAEGASLLPPVAAFKVKPASHAGPVKLDRVPARHAGMQGSAGHAGNGGPHANGNRKHDREVHAEELSGAEAHQAKRPCLPGHDGDAVAGATPSTQPPLPPVESFSSGSWESSRKQIVGHMLAQLRDSKFVVEVQRCVTQFFTAGSGGSATPELLEKLLQELLDAKHPLRAQLRPQLPSLQRELLTWAGAAVETALSAQRTKSSKQPPARRTL